MRETARGWLLRSLLLPLGDVASGQRMMERLRFLEKAQWWDRARLEGERNKLLSSVVNIAFKDTPFYAHLMSKAGVCPTKIRTPEDLRRLPVTTKDMISSAYPHLITRNTGQRTYEKRTSGSTGKNFAVLEDSHTAGWYRASLLLAFQWSGWSFGATQLQTGITPKRGVQKKVKDILLGCHYVSAAALDDQSLDRSLDLIEKRSIQYLWGYPGSMYFLAKRAMERGWNRPLRSVVTWGDNLYLRYRQTIESTFQTRVYDTYGCSEGIEVAAQCGHGANYHLHMLDTIVEYVNEQGEPVPNDQPGSILLTRLHAGPMPLIRYRVGDLGMAGEQSPCPCGRGFERMHSIQGRDTDVILTPSGNRLIVHYFTGLLEHFSEIDCFQVRQTELSSITLLIVPKQHFTSETARRIRDAVQRWAAPDLQVNVEPVQEIPVGVSGKRRFIVSTLSSDSSAVNWGNSSKQEELVR